MKANSTTVLKGQEYWAERLDNFEPGEYFTRQSTVTVAAGDAYEMITSGAGPELHAALNTVAGTDKAKFVVLLSALGALMNKVSGNDDIVIFTGKYRDAVKKTVVNNAVAVRIQQKTTFSESLLYLKDVLKKDFANNQYPAARKLTGESNAATVGMLVTEIQEETSLGDLTPDVLFSFSAGSTLSVSIKYNTAFYTNEYAHQLAQTYFNLLQTVLENSTAAIREISLASAADLEAIGQLNTTVLSYPGDETIAGLFQKQAAERPHQTAVVCGDAAITYAELNSRSNQVAQWLRANGVSNGAMVGLLLDRSIDMVVAVMGVLKSGAAYLPVATDLPLDRVTYMLDKCGSGVLVTNSGYAGKYVNTSRTVLDISAPEISQQPDANLSVDIQPADLAYCIFTSGSNGLPKGVLMEQKSVINLVYGLKHKVYDYFGEEKIRVALLASFAFDASVQQVFPALLLGHSLYIVSDEDRRDGAKILAFYQQHTIDVSDGTPTHLGLVVGAAKSSAVITYPKCWLLAGEVLSKPVVQKFFNQADTSAVKLFNIYGPTEACVDATLYEIEPAETDNRPFIPVGKPLPNTRVYITDSHGKVLPKGLTGELCIAGDGLARGYVTDDPALQGRFSEGLIDGEARVYRTGDMACLLPDGNIEYKGRIDSQVKLRGYRIEMGEIEQLLKSHAQVRDAAVTVIERDDDKYLAAYYAGDAALSNEELRNHLSVKLPEYMIPAYFVYMEELPMTVSGKLNKALLPEPDAISTGEYAAPTNETEEKLQELWATVLKLDKNKIGIYNSFAELGGHSLKLIILANKIRKEFNVNISLPKIIELQNISNLSAEILQSAPSGHSDITKAAVKDHYTLSAAQKRLYILHELDKQSLAYNLPQVSVLEGTLDTERLHDAFSKIIARHESLRTFFEMEGEQPVQKIATEADFKLEHFNADTDGVDAVIKNFIRPFDLSKPTQMRVGLVQVTPAKHILIVDMHHIISDGVTQAILIRDFMALYNGEALPELQLQYKDFAEWEQSKAHQDVLKKRMDFWTREFADDAPVPELPLDFNRPAVKSYAGNKEHFELPAELAGKLKAICNSEGVSMFALILSVYNIMIARLSNLEDVVIGTSVAGRQHADLEKMAGVFINMLPLRNYPRGSMSFREFLQEVKTRTLTSMDNQHQYEELISRLVTERQPNRNPLFDIVLAFHDYDHEELSLPGLTLNLYNSNFHPVAKFDLMLMVREMEGRMLMTFEYSTDIFRNETIRRFAALFQLIAASVAEDMDRMIMDVNVVSEEEETKLVSGFNQTAVTFPADKTFAALFTEQAAKTPGNTAVVCGRRKLTYGELDERSNYIAAKLAEKKGRSGIVGLYTDPSVDMLVGMLGILKSGSAFLPLDTYENTGRIESILADSGCEILLTRDDVAGNLSFAGEVMMIGNESQTENNITGDAANPAYLIFTSGSTGKPKGVKISNSNLVNYSLWLKEFAGLSAEDKSILTSSYAFDLGYTSLFPALLSGAEVHIASKALYQSPEDLLSYIGKNGITYLKLTPSLFSTFISASNFADNTLGSLKHIILGGEPLRLGDIQSVQQVYGDIQFINHYGPTETTIGAVAHKITDPEVFRHKTIIGKPANNTQLFILDKHQKLLPAGAIGELCIAGAGVGLGYLNNEEKTAEVFVTSDLCSGSKLYRTGDMARWQPDGTIEFIGRADGQVKINGYRVELGEIENCLLGYEGIKSAIVVVKDNKPNKYVVAYYVSDGTVDAGILRTYMSQKLPVYMQPAHYITLNYIPLTANGKVNKKALPDPEMRIDTEDLGQSSVIEEKLLDIWADVLKMQKEFISKNVSFLELGGNSLTAIQIVSKIKKTFEIDIKLIELFHRHTIKQQAEFIETCIWLTKAGTEETGKEEAAPVKKYEISF